MDAEDAAGGTPPLRRLRDKIARNLHRIPFAEDALAAYFCATDRRTPAYAKAILAGALGYFVLPVDAIPDVIVGLGFTDDASVIAFALAALARHIRPEHRDRARDLLDRLKRG
ncbi:MAG: YkvA family protein [Alphaproteobacteria bacterium]